MCVLKCLSYLYICIPSLVHECILYMHYIVCFLISHVSDHISCKLPCLFTQSPFLPVCVCPLCTLASSINDECQTQSAKVSALQLDQAHQDDSNYTPHVNASFKSASLYGRYWHCLKLEWALCVSKSKLTWRSRIRCRELLESSRCSLFLWQGQNLCWLNLAFTIHLRVVLVFKHTTA